MDPSLLAAFAGAVGLFTGGAAVVAFRASEAERSVAPPTPVPAVPAGVGDVLAVLRSSAVVLDGSDTVVRASPAAFAMGLVRGAELTSAPLRDLAREVRRRGEIREAELDLPKGPMGGETLVVSARLAPLGAELVLVLVEDRTEQRRLDAVRRDFVANVSHELKTPVGAMHLLAEAMLDACDDPEAVRRFAGRMQHESQRLGSLVQELIDLSRLQSADPLSRPSLVDIDDVIADALDRCRLAAQAKSITLVTAGASALQVLGDEAQLVTAVRNLVDNAVNYSPEGTRVAVGVRRARDVVEITVTDQGIGIAEGDIERIFERFYRVDAARSRQTGGTGLGLSIVKHITANHGGEVVVWSVEGSGSTFTMRLPARPGGTRSMPGAAIVPALASAPPAPTPPAPTPPAPRKATL